MILGLLPLLALLLAVFLLRRWGHDTSEAILLGGIGWAFGILLGNEALSLFHAITFPALLVAWLSAAAALAALLARMPAVPGRGCDAVPKGLTEWLAAGGLAMIAAITLITALVAPPNNWDSLTYHLPRIEHWIQDRSLAFYPTGELRQIMYPGLAEEVVLQFRLLSGGDRFDNLVQWLAGFGSVVAVGRIALGLGASRAGAALARLAGATLPIGILESSSTQNDLVVTFFLLCAAERLLAWRRSRSLADAAALSAAAGLALATKGTAYLIGLPFGVWFLIELLLRGRRAVVPLLTGACLALLPNLPFYLRNLADSGTLIGTLGPDTNNAAFSAGRLVLNAVRNTAVNFVPPDRELALWMNIAVGRGLAILGLNASDPDTTFGSTGFVLNHRQTHEDFAGNPLHFLLALAALAWALAKPWAKGRSRRFYALSVIAGAFLFLIVLRWQPWITRLQLPLFALSAPLAAFLPVERHQGRRGAVLAALLILSAMPALLANYSRRILPGRGQDYTASLWAESREQARFAVRPELLPQYRAAVRFILDHGDGQIGLLSLGNGWEYPLWQMLHAEGAKGLRIEHVFPEPAASPASYPLGPFHPSLIVVIRRLQPSEPPSPLVVDGRRWRRAFDRPALSIYLPCPRACG